MLDQVLTDNDVALKIACYSLVDEFITATSFDGVPPALLGVGKYVVRGKLARNSAISNGERAKAAFEHLLSAVSLLEPDENELAMAADLESEATRSDLELDGGESQLLAILIRRSCRLLITGDKRAIRAIAVVGKTEAGGRIGCLEQLVCHITRMSDVSVVRPRICSEPIIDRTMSICFSCSNEAAKHEDVLSALVSYIKHLDVEVPDVLLSGNDLKNANL